jgi:uncharacterized membrane protein YgcG
MWQNNRGTRAVLNIMKHAVVFSAIFLLGVLAALAEPAPPRRFSNPLLEDVVQMTRAGLSDSTIIAYVKARRARLDEDLRSDDLIRLQRAGVSERVVRYIAGAADVEAPVADRDAEVTYDSRDDGTAYPVEPSDGDGYGYTSWYGYPYWYAYSPYFSSTFFFGGRHFFHGGSFGHRSFGHGGGHSSGHGSGHSSGHGGGHSSGHGGGHGGHGH